MFPIFLLLSVLLLATGCVASNCSTYPERLCGETLNTLDKYFNRKNKNLMLFQRICETAQECSFDQLSCGSGDPSLIAKICAKMISDDCEKKTRSSPDKKYLESVSVSLDPILRTKWRCLHLTDNSPEEAGKVIKEYCGQEQFDHFSKWLAFWYDYFSCSKYPNDTNTSSVPSIRN